jgi:hypothetical protein
VLHIRHIACASLGIIQSLNRVKTHVANPKPVRLTASVWGSLLQLHIQTHCSHIEIRYPGGDLVMEVTSQEASLLAMRGMIAGYVNRDCLRYLIARSTKARILAVLSCDAPRNSHDISIKRAPAMGWATRYDRAKLGIPSARHILNHTPSQVVMRCIGGECTKRAILQ